MPPLIFLAVAGVGLYAGYKLFSALTSEPGKDSRVGAEHRKQTDAERRKQTDAEHRKQASATKGGAKDLGELEWDEKSGAYIPKKSG